MSRPYTQWTMPELRRILARREAGEKWASIAQDYDVTGDALRRALQRNGLGPGLRQGRTERKDEALLLHALRLRNSQWTWPDIVHATGWTKTWQALRKAVHVCAQQRGGNVWCGRGEP